LKQSTEMPNRLINEKSPYLLQHAYNPIEWFPWTEEAFAKAKAEDKPIFLSIGYSTCHWCHVMAHESFEDDEIAEALNKNFVSIKVDREERPDVDAVYMNVTQNMTGSGGWPMTLIMTPDKKPFFAATYIPKKARYNMKGLLDILDIVSFKWKNNKDELINSSNKITDYIKQAEDTDYKKIKLSKEIIKNAYKTLELNFDEEHGGFGKVPKFPQASNLSFLLRYFLLENNKHSLYMVEKSLESMYKGGIFDHIGFGFSRYSTDDKWLVPHFEKMLYDNAQLAICYAEVYQITKIDLFKNVVEKILDYILREMTHEEGGFYSAQDADSEGEEGKYYVFAPDEMINLLGVEDGKYFNQYFDVTIKGNFEGKNILNLINNDDYFERDERIEKLIKKVYEYRLTRTMLHKDDKILTSWNGMMIAAFAIAYKSFNNEKYLESAESAINFIEKYLIDETNNIGVRYREDSVMKNGTLEDYAYYIWGLIEMYSATFKVKYLKRAFTLNEKMIELFFDDAKGGFFMTSKEGESLIYNPKEVYDGAMPSGNSVASYNLMRLAKITGNIKLEEIALKQIEFLTNIVSEYPSGYTFALLSMLFELYPSQELVAIVENDEEMVRFKRNINNDFIANTNVVAIKYSDLNELGEVIKYIKDYKLKDNKTTYYICKNKSCSLPITDLEELNF